MKNLTRSFVAVATALVVAASVVTVTDAPAWAAGSVSVTGPSGSASVDADYATEVTVWGSGFQSIPNGFGGIYVLFGWVDDAGGGSWRPSAGGVVGEDYRYVPDAESAENNGYQRFLAFPGSQTESSANGTLGADGSWSIGMVIPGAVFESQDREGRISEVDCRRVTCGIITIGAHGVKNANNETFTPLSFQAAAPAESTPAESAPAGSAPAAAGAVRVGVEAGSVVAGSSIVFTGQGFTPGEQIVAALDGGLTAVGPLTAGTQGEVAAALPVPRDIRDGTHLITLRGAGSGGVAEAEVSVTGGTSATVAETTPVVPTWAIVVLLACIVLSMALVVTSVITALVRARARRRARRAARVAPAGASAPPAGSGAPAASPTEPLPLSAGAPR
ncbi:hypothetical protein IFU40_04065 [Microbacterium sp. CFBP 13617]|uniref:hypothetical protein n=1 Tax=Microbacterium sp. CFBP 13617 TaxID=2774035 RepID=UPI00177C64DC|nr:hypothetical protein [Microbacterium sp. CFBP 13617]MBD8217809.1 hypothetical protein [Microbacterium sp. CFBP 13617]